MLHTFLSPVPSRLRGLLWTALSDTGRVGARATVDDQGGGVTTTWVYGDLLPCRIDPLTGNEASAGGRISDRSTHLVTVPAETEVTTDGRFVIDGRGTYEVTGVQDRTGELARFFEVVQVS